MLSQMGQNKPGEFYQDHLSGFRLSLALDLAQQQAQAFSKLRGLADGRYSMGLPARTYKDDIADMEQELKQYLGVIR